ncbi:MAG: BON domain-containing protein [Candidimonas sp.]
MMKSHTPRLFLACAAMAAAAMLAGCGALVVGGVGATTAAVATDRRTVGEQVEDRNIILKMNAETRKRYDDKARVTTTAYASWVLLTGDVPTEQDKQQVGQIAQDTEKVIKVINELRVGDITPLGVRSNDTWLTSKVRTALLNTKGVPSRTIVVTTERGVVYLMGKVTEQEGQLAAKAAAGVTGVNQVVKVFEIVAAESLITDDRTEPAPVTTPSSSSNAPQPAEEGAQAMPVQ